jgi:SAM-dependent methyltransferase
MSRTDQFSLLTESWGMPMPDIEKEMIFRRYSFLAEMAAGKRLLEVGCGAGLGNHLLDGQVDVLCSFDLEKANIDNAVAHAPGLYGCADAQRLPFADASFDVVAACEMIYYVPDQAQMLTEIRRVLRPGGAVFLAMANPERPGFHHSPFSTHYPSARSATALLAAAGFTPQVYGVFPLSTSLKSRVLRLASRLAVKFHLVPKTLSGRGKLKKLFYGELTPYEGVAHLTEATDIPQPVAVSGQSPCTGYSVLYAVGRLPA